MTRNYDNAFANASRFVNEALEDGFELREIVAMAMGTVQSKYAEFNNTKAERAVGTAHDVFMNEL